MPRISKPPEERKQEFLEAACQLFFEKGYEKTSVTDIVTRINVAQGLFYYYFKSKQECFEEVIDYMSRNFLKNARELANKGNSAQDRMRAVFDLLMQYVKEFENVSSLSDKNQERFSEMERRVRQSVMTEMIVMLQDVIESGNEDGSFHCIYPEETAKVITLGLITLIYEENVPSTQALERKRGVLEDIACRLLGCKPYQPK